MPTHRSHPLQESDPMLCFSDHREVGRPLLVPAPLGETSEHDRLRASAARFTTALTDPQLGFELDELETFLSKQK